MLILTLIFFIVQTHGVARSRVSKLLGGPEKGFGGFNTERYVTSLCNPAVINKLTSGLKH
jgi:hypothetical protein